MRVEFRNLMEPRLLCFSGEAGMAFFFYFGVRALSRLESILHLVVVTSPLAGIFFPTPQGKINENENILT